MKSNALSWSNLAIFQWRTGQWCHLPDHTVAGGSQIAIIGGCGTGKTALARAFCGFQLPKTQKGDVLLAGRRMAEIPEAEIARKIAYVPTQANLAFSGIRQTLDEEMALTLQFLKFNAIEASDAVTKWADFFGIRHLLRRDPLSLSGGESVLAALAISMVKEPEVIILDNNYDFLHPDTREVLREVVRKLSQAGGIVIETFPRAPDWVHKFDQCLFLSHPQVVLNSYVNAWPLLCRTAPDLLPPLGRITHDVAQSLNGGEISCPLSVDDATNALRRVVQSRAPHSEQTVESLAADCVVESAGKTALKVSALEFEYPESKFKLGPASLDADQGEVIALIGANGAGKTTLMKLIACLLEPESGTIAVALDGTNTWESPPSRRHRHRWARFVLYGFQNPDDQLYLGSVREELASVARHIGKPVTPDALEQMATVFGLGDHLAKSPLDLPGPMRRMVTLAAAFLADPPVLLLDEPTGGLDVPQTKAVQRALRSYATAGGACLFISHDREFVADTASRFLEVSGGQIRGQGPLRTDNHQAGLATMSSFGQQVAHALGLPVQPKIVPGALRRA